MRLLKLTVTDLPADDRDVPTHPEWTNPRHIETAVPYVTWHHHDPVLWLELTLSSGVVRYHLVGPVDTADIDGETERALERLFPH